MQIQKNLRLLFIKKNKKYGCKKPKKTFEVYYISKPKILKLNDY
jgi:hypothetical protein